jgi:uncharacterized peroxidase-related enzyme
MERIPLVSEALPEVERRLGRVPNLYRALANSPAALHGYLAMRDELAKGVLSARVREQLALLVAQENSCGYCVSAHSLRGTRMGFTEDELLRTRKADSDDLHTRLILQVAQQTIRTGGKVSDELLTSARAAGVSDAELAEIVAHVALNVLSNYFNHLARPELDFPEMTV